MAPRSATASTTGIAPRDAHTSWVVALQTPPTKFYPKYGPLPAIVAVQGQPAAWDTVGYTRTLTLSDGSNVVETITDSTSDTFFAYNLRDFTQLFGMLVRGARAEWTFTPAAHGTRIDWAYAFYPLPGRGWIVHAIVRFFWAPYMRRVLRGIIRSMRITNT